MWCNDAERATVQCPRDVVRRDAGHTDKWSDARGQPGHAELTGGIEREAVVLHVDIERVESGGFRDLRDLHRANQADDHRCHDLIARQLVLDGVAQEFS